jgi:hypothetical protein
MTIVIRDDIFQAARLFEDTMLTITPEALAIIRKQKQPVFLDMPKLITNCCFNLQECPSVRFGEPRKLSDYEQRTIQDVTVFAPHSLPDIPLTITVGSFLGIKRLVLEGWCLA